MKPTSLLPLLALAAATYKGDDAWPALQKAIADYPKLVSRRGRRGASRRR